jgi:hypothetical protein
MNHTLLVATILLGLAACSRTLPINEGGTLTQTRFGCVDIDLGDEVPLSIGQSTIDQPNEMTGSCGGDRAPEVTFLWTAPADGIYVFDTLGSDYDTLLYATVSACSGDELDCNDDAPGAISSIMTIQAEAGAQIVLTVDGFLGTSGNFRLQINEI